MVDFFNSVVDSVGVPYFTFAMVLVTGLIGALVYSISERRHKAKMKAIQEEQDKADREREQYIAMEERRKLRDSADLDTDDDDDEEYFEEYPPEVETIIEELEEIFDDSDDEEEAEDVVEGVIETKDHWEGKEFRESFEVVGVSEDIEDVLVVKEEEKFDPYTPASVIEDIEDKLDKKPGGGAGSGDVLHTTLKKEWVVDEGAVVEQRATFKQDWVGERGDEVVTQSTTSQNEVSNVTETSSESYSNDNSGDSSSSPSSSD